MLNLVVSYCGFMSVSVNFITSLVILVSWPIIRDYIDTPTEET